VENNGHAHFSCVTIFFSGHTTKQMWTHKQYIWLSLIFQSSTKEFTH